MSLKHRFAVLGMAALAAGAAVLGTASAAHAAGTSIVVTAASVSGSPVSAFATATCPAGYNLVGAGGGIDGGGGDVVMTDVIPTVSAGTVTVWGHEKGAFAGNWSVVAHAICDSVITGVVRIGVNTASNATTPKTVTPMCPAGKTLSGVGYQLQNGNGEVFPDDVSPNFALDGALLTAYANGGYAANWSFSGYAICADLPAGAVPQRLAAVTAFNSFGSKSISTATCPAGTRGVGVGGELTGGVGNVVLDRIGPDAQVTLATTRADEFGAYANNWELLAYLVCW